MAWGSNWKVWFMGSGRLRSIDPVGGASLRPARLSGGILSHATTLGTPGLMKSLQSTRRGGVSAPGLAANRGFVSQMEDGKWLMVD